MSSVEKIADDVGTDAEVAYDHAHNEGQGKRTMHNDDATKQKEKTRREKEKTHDNAIRHARDDKFEAAQPPAEG